MELIKPSIIAHYDDNYAGGCDNSYRSNRAGRLTATSKNNPCPICQDHTGRCRISSDNLVLCHQFFDSDSGAAGYRFVKPANNPRWGIHAPEKERQFSDTESRAEWRARRERERLEREADLAARLSPLGRHLAYKILSRQLTLSQQDRDKLLQRGISPEQIERLGYRSVKPRQSLSTHVDPKLPGISSDGRHLTINNDAIIFPIPNRDGWIIGWQYRQSSAGAKYIWPKSRFSSHLPNGELPIGYYLPDDKNLRDTKTIGLCEGFSKPPVAANLAGIVVIGAAGGNFSGSPQQTTEYLHGFERAILFADAGSIENRNIIAAYEKTVEFCRRAGLQVSVAWYGQDKKVSEKQIALLRGDIDEISHETYRQIKYITWDEWLKLCLPSAIPVKQQPFDFAAANATERRNLTRFSADMSFSSRYFPGSLSIPEKANVIAIKGPKGTGKTVFLSRLATATKTLILTHRVCLEEDLANVFRLDSRHNLTREGQLLGHALCINSLHPFANPRFNYRDWDGADLIMDEFDQMFAHLTTSGTCNTFKSEIINTWMCLMKQVINTGGRIYISSADLSDIHISFINSILDGFPVQTFSIENAFVPYNGQRLAYCYDDSITILSSAEKALANGKRVLFFTTSRGTAGKFGSQNLEKYFTDCGYKVLRADSESVSTPGHDAARIFSQQTTTQDSAWFESLRDYDILIATPVLETGVSIVGVFDEIYYLSEAGVQTVESVGQSMARERANVPRHFYVPRAAKTRFGAGSTKWLQIYNDQSAAAQKVLAEQNNYALIGVEFTANPFHQLFCKMAALQNIGFTSYRDSIIENLQQSGYIVQMVDKRSNDELKESIEEIKESQHKIHCETVANSLPLTPEEKQKIQRKRKRTDIERERLERQEIADKFVEPRVESDLVSLYEKGFYEHATTHYLLTEGAEFIQMKDIRAVENLLRLTKNQAFELDLLKAVKSPRLALLHELGIAQFLDPQNEFTNEGLSDWFDGIIARKNEIRKVLGISNFKQTPIAWVNQQLLSRIGLKLIQLGQRRVNGKRVRMYGGVGIDEIRGKYFARWKERDATELARFNLESEQAAVSSEIVSMSLSIMRRSPSMLQVGIDAMTALSPPLDGQKYSGVRAEILALSVADQWSVYGQLLSAAAA